MDRAAVTGPLGYKVRYSWQFCFLRFEAKLSLLGRFGTIEYFVPILLSTEAYLNILLPEVPHLITSLTCSCALLHIFMVKCAIVQEKPTLVHSTEGGTSVMRILV